MPQRPKQPLKSMDQAQLLCHLCLPSPPKIAEEEPEFSTPEYSEIS